MAAIVKGRTSWDVSRDAEGHRSYKLELFVKSALSDGPASVMNAVGMPAIGSYWQFGSDVDLWAFCTPEMTVKPVITKEPNRHWVATLTFSTRPHKRCQDQSIEDPLLEPPKISGSFNQYSKEVEKDRHDKFIRSSSHDIIRGIEKKQNHPTIVIEHNVAALGLDTFSEMINTVNDRTLWGLPKRCIMLANVSWDRKIYGLCNYYYTRRFEFEVDYDTWDFKKDGPNALLDVGFKVLKGRWENDVWVAAPGADKTKPTDFVMYHDKNGNITQKQIALDGNGMPLTDPTNPAFIDDVELYDESNFLTLGIPASL